MQITEDLQHRERADNEVLMSACYVNIVALAMSPTNVTTGIAVYMLQGMDCAGDIGSCYNSNIGQTTN